MMFPILSETEFKKELAYWVLDNDRGAFIPYGYGRKDFADLYRLPDFDYVHFYSYVDGDGDVLTMLKSEVHLKDWETRNGRIPRTFKFYKILKTFTDSPEVEPFPMGYIIESKD